MTARRRSERLQTVPIAVTSLSGRELAKQNAQVLSQIALTVPSLQIKEGPGSSDAPILAIRGQVQNDTVSTLDPSVGIYVDDIYWARASGANATLADISTAEVLRGPQGTLFGRNTTGGALNIHTTEPSLTTYSGLASVTIGDYGERDGTVAFGGPIVPDKLGIRVVVDHQGNDGYGYSSTTDQRLQSLDATTVRVKLLAQPIEPLQIRVSYENYGEYGTPTPEVLDYVQPGGVAAQYGEFYPLLFEGKPPGNLSDYLYTNPHVSSAETRQAADARTQTAAIRASYDFDFGTLKLIEGYRKVSTVLDVDLDGTPLPLLSSSLPNTGEQNSTEIQFTGKALADRLTYTLGYFFFEESGHDDSTSIALGGLNPANPSLIRGDYANRSQAGYGQATYKVTDKLSFTAGLRFSVDHKDLVSHNAEFLDGTYYCTVPAHVGASSPQACSQGFAANSSATDFLVSADYKFTPDLLGYAKVSSGYRAGGNNLRGAITPESFAPFAPETVTSYEVGIKSEFLQHRLRVNLAGYYEDYDNIQRSIIITVPGAGEATVVENAAKGYVYGGEAETQYIVVDGLRVGGTLSLTQAYYSRYQDAQGSHVGEPYPYTPKVQTSATVDYTRPVPFGTANLHGDFAWQTDEYLYPGFAGSNFPLAAQITSSLRQHDFGILNLRASYTLEKYNIEFALFGRNVTNVNYRASAVDFANAGLGLNTVLYGPPASYGGQITYRF